MPGNGAYQKFGVLVDNGNKADLLPRHQIHEAGYLTARAAMGRPIDNQRGDLRRLVHGNESVNETRERLHFGRSNVDPDLIASEGVSGQRMKAARQLAKSAPPGPARRDRVSAAAVALGGGNCAEHAQITSRVHAPRLQGQETVSSVNLRPALDHSFNQIRTPGRPTVTLDAWANGPAMEELDTNWGTAPLPVKTYETFNTQNGKLAKDNMLNQAKSFASGPERQIATEILQQTSRKAIDAHTYGAANQLAGSVVPKQPSFGDRARDSLQSTSSLNKESMAVSAMRRGYRMNVASAAALAQPVLEAAQTLDTMPDELARPPIRKPPPRKPHP